MTELQHADRFHWLLLAFDCFMVSVLLMLNEERKLSVVKLKNYLGIKKNKTWNAGRPL